MARYVVGHPQPFFAPVAAMVCLGFSFGQRLRRVAEVMVGVAVGVGVGDLFVRIFGTGVPQIVFVVALAMSVAVLLGAGTLMSTQAGVQAAIVTTLLPNPSAGFSRWHRRGDRRAGRAGRRHDRPGRGDQPSAAASAPRC